MKRKLRIRPALWLAVALAAILTAVAIAAAAAVLFSRAGARVVALSGAAR
jgi:hypothetical protein